MRERFVLVHGSWHDGSAWSGVARCLAEEGHAVYTPTAGGRGAGADPHVTHAQEVAPIVAEIVKRDLRNVILVGHSLGGTWIAKVAEAIPERIKRLVFFSAFVLRDGESVLDTLPPVYSQVFQDLAVRSPDGTFVAPYPLWRESFINDADDGLARQVYAERLTPEPFGPLTEKLDLRKFWSLQIPRSYLTCSEDTSMPPGPMWWVLRQAVQLGLYRFLRMPGSHEVMFTNPMRLAKKLVEAGCD